MDRMKCVIALCIFGLFAAGCETTVLRQDVPVSSNPMGASILADGRPAGQTPGTVSLERNRDHIITLFKQGYHQVDMPITRQYQSNKVMMKAVQSGVNSGLFFKSTSMGMSSGMNSISYQEESGEAYILAPPSVAVSLVPLRGQNAGQPAYPAATTAVPSPPQPAGSSDIRTRDAVAAGIIVGTAAGAGQPNPVQKTWETSSSRSNTTSSSASVTTGSSRTVTPAPGRTETRSSSSTHTTSSSTTSTRSTTTSVSVGVNPMGALGIIDALFSR